MKHFTLKFIQIAWVAEMIAILLFTMIITLLLPPARVNLWHQFLPIFSTLIGAQGGAAWAGPLLADRMKTKTNKEEL